MIGCSFVVDREYFGDIGLLDPGMEVYGGENIELGMRVSDAGLGKPRPPRGALQWRSMHLDLPGGTPQWGVLSGGLQWECLQWGVQSGEWVQHDGL